MQYVNKSIPRPILNVYCYCVDTTVCVLHITAL